MVRKVELSPPPSLIEAGLPSQWLKWMDILFRRVGNGPLKQQGYSRTGLPVPEDWGSQVVTDPFTSTIFVYDAVGGATLAFSDGASPTSSWISCITGVAV